MLTKALAFFYCRVMREKKRGCVGGSGLETGLLYRVGGLGCG